MDSGDDVTTFGGLCCEACGISGSVTAMHRANPKGEKGRWRCAPCLGRPVARGVLAITDAVQLGVDPHSLGATVIEMGADES